MRSSGGPLVASEDFDDKPRARILVVDDEEPIRRLLTQVLQVDGYECESAGDVLDADGKLRSSTFDVILTDMNMPGESGLDLIISARTKHPDVPVIMITGVEDPNFAEMTRRFGAAAHMVKPVEPDELLTSVSDVLSRQRTLVGR